MAEEPPTWATAPEERAKLRDHVQKGEHGAISAKGGYRGRDSDEASDFSEDDYGRMARDHVKRGCFLSTCVVLNAVTIVAALAVAVAQVLAVIYTRLPPEGIGIRAYTVLFCMLIVSSEMEWFTSVRELSIFTNWISKGLLYMFVGLLTLEEQRDKDLNEDPNVTAFIVVTGWIIAGIGAIYFVMGIFCVQRIRDKKYKKYKALVAHAEMQDNLKDHDIA